MANGPHPLGGKLGCTWTALSAACMDTSHGVAATKGRQHLLLLPHSFSSHMLPTRPPCNVSVSPCRILPAYARTWGGGGGGGSERETETEIRSIPRKDFPPSGVIHWHKTL